MNIGAGQNRADRNLSIRYVGMEFKPTPVLLVSIGRCLDSDGALPDKPANIAGKFMCRCRSINVPRSAALACFGFGPRFFFLQGSGGGPGNRSRATMAVESREICPINRCFWVERISVSCSFCGSSVLANSAKARENVDS